MSIFFSKNKINIEKINSNYRKLKITNFIIKNKVVIFCDPSDVLSFKNKLLSYNISSLTLNKRYIKALFNLPNFAFLEGDSFFCIFINKTENFIDIINYLDNKKFFYLYKNSLSNYSYRNILFEEFKKYNKNFCYFQLFFLKKKLKIIILLVFFLLSLIKFIK